MKIIKTSEALPKSGRYVLAWLEGAKIPMRAMWAAQHTLPLGDDADPEWGEYSEEKDEYFCPAGWYEMNQHEEQHWGVSGNVVAWCELPRLEAGAAPAAVAGPTDDDLRKALQFYANGEHFILSERDTSWDTVSGEPQNYWCDEAGTATVEDGTIAKMALAGQPIDFEEDDAAPALEAPAHQCCNSWFLSLPEGRQAVLRENQWMLADAAYQAGRESRSALEAPAAPAVPLKATPEMRAAFRRAYRAGSYRDREIWGNRMDYALDQMLAAAPQAPNCTRCSGSGEDPEGYLTHGHGPDDHTVDGPCRECDGTGAAPQAPAAPSPYSADLLAALGQWHQRSEVMGAHHTLTEAQIAELVVAGLLRRAHGGQVITAAGRAALAAPAAPAVDAETIHLQDLKNALAECRELRQQVRLMDEQQAGSVWRWQADGRDQLETMGNHMGVLIRACDLRALVAGAAPAVDAELLELAQAIVKYNRQHGGVLAVHINNLADLVDERAAQAKEGGA